MNQSCTYIITLFCFALTDYVPYGFMRYRYGWAIIGIVGFFIVVNIVVQTFDIFKHLIEKGKWIYYKLREINRRIKEEKKKTSGKTQSMPESEAPNTTQIVTSTHPEHMIVQHTKLKPINQKVYKDLITRNDSFEEGLDSLESS
jgi:hypothetical protein